MQVKDITERLEEKYPLNAALSWDNVGLLAGRMDKEVKSVYVALDATDEVVAEAIRQDVDLLLTHHPLIFSPLKNVTDMDFVGRRLVSLLKKDVSYYAMHTNYDVLRMSELSARRLGLTQCDILKVTADENFQGGIQGIGRVGELSRPEELGTYCEKVKESFGLPSVKVFGNLSDKILKVAVSPGSGSSVVADAIEKGADVLVTGDIDHHTGIDAAARGLHIIDAGHYGIEHIFVQDMKKYLLEIFKDMKIKTAPHIHPFSVI